MQQDTLHKHTSAKLPTGQQKERVVV